VSEAGRRKGWRKTHQCHLGFAGGEDSETGCAGGVDQHTVSDGLSRELLDDDREQEGQRARAAANETLDSLHHQKRANERTDQ